MAFARALRNGIVAFAVAYAVTARVAGDRSLARRIAGMTGGAVLVISLMPGRADGDEEPAADDGGRAVPAAA